jgi:hypothetical protein|tara:strand:+ start:83 stop:301 length:219 start_codon:yes stop_codon:yes gene_type:complete
MTVVKDITNQILVPKPVKKVEYENSFFIGRVAMDTQPETTDIEVNLKDTIKQRHLDNSKVIDTEWKAIKDVY